MAAQSGALVLSPNSRFLPDALGLLLNAAAHRAAKPGR